MVLDTRISEDFDLATHNGVVTVRSCSGEHRTFRISTQADDAEFAPGERILYILAGPDNTADYMGLGFVKPDGRVILWKRHRGTQIEKIVRVLQRVTKYREMGFEYFAEGRCRRCGRTLTTPESIRSGIGPVCQEKEFSVFS
jgi:hypothetical protein